GHGGDRQDRHRHYPCCRLRFFWTLTAFERAQIAMHVRGRSVTFLRIVRTGFDQDVVELQQLLAVGTVAQLRIDLRKIEPVFAGADFIKKFAETENISLRRAWSLRRHVTFGANKRLLTAGGDEADVGELRYSADENNVRRLDGAMSQAVAMQRFQCFGQ